MRPLNKQWIGHDTEREPYQYLLAGPGKGRIADPLLL